MKGGTFMNKENLEDNLVCKVNLIHEDQVRIAKEALPDEDMLKYLAEFFKIFGDLTRTKILFALEKRELCVCDLSALLEMSQSAVSHQLRFLKNYRVVKTRRDGKVIYYSLDDDHISHILKCGLDHAMEESNVKG